MTAARRLAAILAVDVVGYSRLMGEDEAGDGAAYAHAGKMDGGGRPPWWPESPAAAIPNSRSNG